MEGAGNKAWHGGGTPKAPQNQSRRQLRLQSPDKTEEWAQAGVNSLSGPRGASDPSKRGFPRSNTSLHRQGRLRSVHVPQNHSTPGSLRLFIDSSGENSSFLLLHVLLRRFLGALGADAEEAGVGPGHAKAGEGLEVLLVLRDDTRLLPLENLRRERQTVRLALGAGSRGFPQSSLQEQGGNGALLPSTGAALAQPAPAGSSCTEHNGAGIKTSATGNLSQVSHNRSAVKVGKGL